MAQAFWNAFLEPVPDEVGDRSRLAEADTDVDQCRHDADEETVHDPVPQRPSRHPQSRHPQSESECYVSQIRREGASVSVCAAFRDRPADRR